MYATSEQISDKGFVHQSLAIDHSTPPNFNKADTTPINAPPAMNPLAIRVPFSPRSLFTFSSLDRDVTYQFMAPPTTRGTFNCNGINIPSEKARAGIWQRSSTIAITAPVAYNTHGAPTPFIRGSITAAIALACGADRLLPAKP